MATPSPTYYNRGATPVWDFIRDQGLNFHLGNAIKYICRAGYKDSRIDDLAKAIHYLSNELEHEKDFLIRTGEGIQDQIRDPELSCEAYELVSEKSDC